MAQSQETIIAYTTKHTHITTAVINELFVALEKVRKKFKATISNTSEFNTSIASKNAFIYGGNTSYPYYVKQDMAHIEKSVYVPANYSIQVTIPNAADYIYAGTLYNSYVDLINEMYNLCIHNNSYCGSQCDSVCSSDCGSQCTEQSSGCPQNCSGYTWMYSTYELNGVGYTNKCAADENCSQESNFNTGYTSNTGAYYGSYGSNGAYCDALTAGCDFFDPAACTTHCTGECGTEYGSYCRSHDAADVGCLCHGDCGSDCGSECGSRGSYSSLSSYGSLGTYSSHTSNSSWGSCSGDHAANYSDCGGNCGGYNGSQCMDNQGCACIRD